MPLDISGFEFIIGIKAAMNLGLSDKLKHEFPSVIPAIRPTVNFEGIADPN